MNVKFGKVSRALPNPISLLVPVLLGPRKHAFASELRSLLEAEGMLTSGRAR